MLLSYLVICIVAFVASGLTFFSGFGLGTLLLPAFALFFPLELAISLTAIVHFLNGLFKLGLVGRHANRRVLLRFGIPAIAFSFLGAWLLLRLSGMEPLITYTAFGRQLQVFPVNLIVGLVLFAFVLAELLPRLHEVSFGQKFLPLGGALSGFFGGLSGMQGALRSAFLVKAGLSKEAFVATGVVIACLIDISRLGVYAKPVIADSSMLDYPLLLAAVLAAFAGAFLGNRYIRKLTMHGIQTIVAIMLFLVAVGLIAGLL